MRRNDIYLVCVISCILSVSLLIPSSSWSAGTVQVFQKGINLHIKGDHEANKVTLSQTQINEVTVTGVDGTTIEGGPTFTNVAGFLHIVLKQGDDVVAAPGMLELDGSISAKLGAGNDALTLTQPKVVGTIRVQRSDGNDTPLIGDETDALLVQAFGDIKIQGGSGIDSIQVHDPA